jgi:hypothetical protein
MRDRNPVKRFGERLRSPYNIWAGARSAAPSAFRDYGHFAQSLDALLERRVGAKE